MHYTARHKLYLTADRSRVVKVGDNEAGYVFRAPGHTVTQEEVDKYGIPLDYLTPNRQEADATEATPEKVSKPVGVKINPAKKGMKK